MNMRRFLILLGLLGIIILVLSGFGNLHKIAQAFTEVRWYVVPLVISIQLVSYYCNAKYYETFFNIFGSRVPFRQLYEASLGVFFANQTIPSAGASGTAYLAQALRQHNVAFGKAALAQLGRYSFTFFTFFVVLAFGFLMLFLTGDLNKVSVRFVLLLMIIILATGLVLLIIFSERRRLQTFLRPPIHLLNVTGRIIFRRKSQILPPSRLDDFLDDFYHGYHEIMSHKGRWPALLWWTLGANLAEVLTVFAVFVGFGHLINPGVVITGYALAIFASLGALLIGGLGAYEAGMIGTFTALGVPFPQSFAVVIVYRVLTIGLFLPPGLHFYRKYLKEAK